ncbi:MAG: right-handed parallel beta-helix repeat-containing protein [Bacteroidia bacterium]|nr:right-handed parallel beta-helix repeat-containing protein [Bacteroidia bacterium]
MRNILIGLATFFVLESGAQCMSGVYTIGGVSPNYSTINAAVSALVSNGICGPVSLNIRNGVYNERISLPAISGSSPINTITFQSESGDSSLVTISETSVSGNNYVVRLNGSDNVIFRKLSIVNGASGTTSYQSTFVMNNDADNITVESCVMSCLPNANSNIVNNSFALIFAGYTLGTIGDSITIRNNRLIGNNYGVSLYYSTPTYPENLVIHNNLIVDQYNYGIRTGFYGKISITRNEIIQTAPSPLLYYAFLGGTTDTIFVSNNKIRGYGSGLSILGLSSTCYAKVWNNDIVVQGLGITVSYLTCQVYHNTVRTESPTGNALTALWIGQGILQCDVRNNIFLNRGPGVSYGLIHLDHVSPAVYSGDGNVFDCGTYKLFSFIYPTILQHYQYLYQWSAVTGGDLSSASSNAQFVSSSNSHILNDFSQNASAGIVGGIITDADGAPRSLIRPYPGAYESVRLVGNDASAIIVRSNPTECTGNFLLNVLVQNRGLTPLTSVQVNWTLNNVVQIPYLWTGSINSMDTVAISAISFPAAIGNTYAIKAWTSQPNSSSDVYMMNDTTPDDTIRISYTGNYTVGGIAPDFATITQAITALRSNGICNAVTLSLRNGTYNEQVLIDSSLGSSALNTLRITSETGDSTQVIWQYNSTNLNYQYVGRLSGASYVTVDHITVQQLSAVYPTVVQIDGGAHDINFSSCILTSPASIQNPPGGAIVSSPSTEENFLKFRNTIFNGGSTGIYLLAPNTGENGLEIANCWFNNQSQTGIYALAIGQLVLTDNVISSNAPNMQVGINVGMKDTCVISNNIVDGSFEKGMQLSNLNLLPNPVLTIFNNSINGRFRSTAQYGIFVWQIDKFKMNFNTVRLATPNSHAVYLWATDSASVQNNVFSVFASNGRAFSMYSTWSSGFVENYNDLYVSSGLQLYKDPVLYTSMSAWRNATGFSMNSMEVDPNFLIPNDCHIHESDLRNTGTSIVGISEDFEHEPRSNPPDIGADEQTSSYVDIECKRIVLPVALCAGVVNVPMVLKNQGTVLINQATINWSVNGVPQPVVNWSGALASGDSIIVSLGNYNFLTNGPPYNVECIVSNPNLLPDPFAFNDTAFYSVGGSALSGTYTIGGASPDFANVVQATTALNARGVCGPVTMKIRNGTYSGAIQLNSIAGASSVNRIRFESQSGDSSQVIITAVGSSTANYSVGLTGASFITFSKVTFSNSNATYGSVMRITGTCKSDSIYHCVFTTSPSATNADLIYEGGAGSKTNFDIIGNRFINGRNAVNWFYNSPDSNFVFSRNKVQCNQANGEVRLSYIYGLKVEDNDIILGSVRTEYIYSSLLVRKNRINGMLGVEYCNNSTSVLIVNNVVTNSGGVLFVQNSDGLRIINNTFRCTGNTTCVTLGSSINITYFNNLVTTTSATGTLFSANYALTFDTCNYNGWYMVNGIFCSFNSVNYASFTAWQTTSGYDANSVFQDPLFLSPTDFHLQNSSPMLQHALPVSEAPDDIDGDLRGPTPDLGGDENPVYTVEIAVTGSNISSCLSASTPITIDVLNNGSLPLTSCTINWSVNQIVQTPVNWSGSISPYQTMSGIPVSTYPFVLGHSYQVIIWISSPNNSIDPLPYNDSVSGLALPRYSGLYTVGGNSPDFVNPQAAVDSLSTNGVCGPVTLRIRSGTYNGIEIEAIPGSSIQNSVTLTSETGDSSDVVFLTIPDSLTSYNGATFLLDSTSNIIFDRLTFSSGLSVVPILIQFVNNNENITITHCRFNGIHGTIAPTVHNGLIDTRSGFYSKVKISNCQLPQSSAD